MACLIKLLYTAETYDASCLLSKRLMKEGIEFSCRQVGDSDLNGVFVICGDYKRFYTTGVLEMGRDDKEFQRDIARVREYQLAQSASSAG